MVGLDTRRHNLLRPLKTLDRRRYNMKQNELFGKKKTDDSYLFDSEGYDEDGYNRDGYDRKGFKRDGFNKEGLNEYGQTRYYHP
jgi:hypothetical protein